MVVKLRMNASKQHVSKRDQIVMARDCSQLKTNAFQQTYTV